MNELTNTFAEGIAISGADLALVDLNSTCP